MSVVAKSCWKPVFYDKDIHKNQIKSDKTSTKHWTAHTKDMAQLERARAARKDQHDQRKAGELAQASHLASWECFADSLDICGKKVTPTKIQFKLRTLKVAMSWTSHASNVSPIVSNVVCNARRIARVVLIQTVLMFVWGVSHVVSDVDGNARGTEHVVQVL